MEPLLPVAEEVVVNNQMADLSTLGKASLLEP
jgi:hypothetical protein